MAALTVHRFRSFSPVVRFLTSGRVRRVEGPIWLDPEKTGRARRLLVVTLDDGSRHQLNYLAGEKHVRDDYVLKVIDRLLAGMVYSRRGQVVRVHRITWSREL